MNPERSARPPRFWAELRAAELQGDRLRGHAAIFGQHAKIRGVYEALAPTAFDAALRRDNVRALINHDPDKLLGTTRAQTLKVGVDSVGLEFEIPKLPNTSYANDLRELVERGDLDGCSFGFCPGEDAMSVARDGRQIRTHTSVAQLFDVSAATYPAYEGTDLALRSLTFDDPPIDLRTQLILARHRALIAPGGARVH